MTNLFVKTTAAVTSPSSRSTLAKSLWNGSLRRMAPPALAALLCVALAGCATNEQTGSEMQAGDTDNDQVATVSLHTDTIAVQSGKTLVLTAEPPPFDKRPEWQYQWQQVVGNPETGGLIGNNIRGAQRRELVLKNVGAADAKLYRCMVYRTGKYPETNYTTITSLQVTSLIRTALGIQTVVSGSFKPGGGSGSDGCCGTYKDGLVFKNPTTGNWWLAPGSSRIGNAVVTDQTVINYTNYPTCLEIVNGSFSTIACDKLPHAIQFPSSPNQGYMVCLHFSGPIPVTGQVFTYTINWP